MLRASKEKIMFINNHSKKKKKEGEEKNISTKMIIHAYDNIWMKKTYPE